jgi:hypothetical protein
VVVSTGYEDSIRPHYVKPFNSRLKQRVAEGNVRRTFHQDSTGILIKNRLKTYLSSLTTLRIRHLTLQTIRTHNRPS